MLLRAADGRAGGHVGVRHDRSLRRPYERNVSALLHEPTFKQLAGDKVFKLAKEVVRLGNRAAHDKAAAEPARLGDGGVAPVPVLLLVRPHLQPGRRSRRPI